MSLVADWRLAVASVCLAAACCSKSEVKNGSASGDGPIPQQPTFTVFGLAEVRGQIGPCGCTSDPLGDIARTTQLVADARAKGPVLVVDAGSLLYSQSPVPAHLDAQEERLPSGLCEFHQHQWRSSLVLVQGVDLGLLIGLPIPVDRHAGLTR